MADVCCDLYYYRHSALMLRFETHIWMLMSTTYMYIPFPMSVLKRNRTSSIKFVHECGPTPSPLHFFNDSVWSWNLLFKYRIFFVVVVVFIGVHCFDYVLKRLTGTEWTRRLWYVCVWELFFFWIMFDFLFLFCYSIRSAYWIEYVNVNIAWSSRFFEKRFSAVGMLFD